ncbi:hypothetical protein BDA99DRAFT_544516 [Phascolomyces articulosus]|uniref:Uncharacterized protein n=1 Tax=Phascolomyces articulosus TaxID=60185 RepID=A0AAD5P6N6_9FUNG|nr:hypothetical protein BDA99DRAFT_544516 [Phascolomyces articulosus]
MSELYLVNLEYSSELMLKSHSVDYYDSLGWCHCCNYEFLRRRGCRRALNIFHRGDSRDQALFLLLQILHFLFDLKMERRELVEFSILTPKGRRRVVVRTADVKLINVSLGLATCAALVALLSLINEYLTFVVCQLANICKELMVFGVIGVYCLWIADLLADDVPDIVFKAEVVKIKYDTVRILRTCNGDHCWITVKNEIIIWIAFQNDGSIV